MRRQALRALLDFSPAIYLCAAHECEDAQPREEQGLVTSGKELHKNDATGTYRNAMPQEKVQEIL